MSINANPPKIPESKMSHVSFFNSVQNSHLSVRDRDTAFATYNQLVAPHLNTPEAAFNAWANALSYASPRESESQRSRVISLHVNSPEYAHAYVVDKIAGGARGKIYLLVPADGSHRRAIVLGMGTSPVPVVHFRFPNPSEGRWLPTVEVEAVGVATDLDEQGVGTSAWTLMRRDVNTWTKSQAESRDLTFIGHSLGGALAMLALSDFAGYNYKPVPINGTDAVRRAHLYTYSAPGTGPQRAIDRLNNLVSAPNRKAFWNRKDLVTKVGLHPTTNGTEMVYDTNDGYTNDVHNPVHTHCVPFVALNEGRSVNYAYREAHHPNTTPILEWLRSHAGRVPLLGGGIDLTIKAGALAGWAAGGVFGRLYTIPANAVASFVFNNL